MGHERGPVDIGLEDCAEVLSGGTSRRACHALRARDTGVVDQDVNAAEICLHFLRGGGNRVIVCDVDLEKAERALRLAGLDLRKSLLAFGYVACADDDMVVWRGRGKKGRGVVPDAGIGT